ncbi:MAG: TonB-dependent receptor, partial [Verrucomicrobiota bacterium]
ELDLARRVDALDPTAWLYSALLNRQWNRINEAIEDLEQSKSRNDERSLFRSKLLLDQDQAVRGANLAGLYRDAGLDDVSVREASRSVNFDYANASAHLFLANSYDALRDPRQVNLRYETPWFSELLLANLLAPIGAGSLSQTISQQDYSRLFARDRLGFSSGTEYQSAGDWHQYASHFGTFGGSSYAGDVIYTRRQGQRPNEDVEQWTVYGKFKQQLTAQDQLLVFANYYQLESGDVRQVYDPASPSFFSSTLRFRERQEPNAFAGWHHEWAPGSHTLLLVGRLDDEIELTDPDAPFLTLALNRDDSIRRGLQPRAFHQTYASALEAWTAELQHLWQTEKHTLIAGSRWQAGETESRLNVFRSATAFPANLLGTNSVAELNAIDQFISADLERFSIYGYSHWQIFDAFQLISGLSYDRLVFPNNIDQAPISEGEREKDRVSPKVGFLWALAPNTWFRGAYTRSLGGLYYDASVRLEPAQVAGFIQAFRSLAPESEIGAAPGMMQETTALGFDHRFATRTYFSVEGEILKSEGDRKRGVFMSPDRIPGVVEPAFAATLTETLEFEERSLNVSVNQLLGERWSFGARYRISDAELTAQFPDVPVRALASAATQTRGTLQHAMLYVVHYVPCGFFAQADLNWFAQSNRGYTPDRPGDEFWQSNAWLGYRFRNRIAEVSLGVLNIGGQDYRLNPLNLHAELPRERTFAARLKLNL